MIVFSCPNCDVEIEAPDNKAGAKATCAECGVRLEIPNGAKKATPVTAQKPAAKRRRDDDLDEPPAPAEKPRPAAKRRRDDDEDEPVETPRGKRRASRDEDEEEDGGEGGAKSKGPVLWIGGGAAAAVAAGVLVIVLMNGGKKESTAPPPQAKKPDTQVENPVKPVGDEKKIEGVKPEEDDLKEDLVVAETKGPANAQDIYRHVLKSACVIFNVLRDRQGAMAQGSGSLIDKKNRLVLTNYHVVMGRESLWIIFPIYDPSGKLITEKEVYRNRLTQHSPELIPGHVVKVDRAADLAVIQLDRVPDAIEQLAVAKQGVNVGESVYSVGSPGLADALWLLAEGHVRQVYPAKMRVGGGSEVLNLNCQMIQTDSPTHRGDSGGPLVNGNGALVGVTESGILGTPGYSFFVELSEVRRFVEEVCQKAKVTWNEGDGKPLVVQNTGQITEYVRYLKHKNPKVRVKAMQLLAGFGSGARMAIPQLIPMLKDPEEVNRAVAQETLARIGAPDTKEVGLLAKSLKDSTPAVRAYAASALGKLGRAGRPAAQDLAAALKDADAGVRCQAALALGKVGYDIGYDNKKKAHTFLGPLLEDPDQDVRVAAAVALTWVCPLGPSDLPFLQKDLLKHRDAGVKTAAVDALARMGPTAKPALPAVIAALKDDLDRSFRRAAMRLLAKFGPDAKDAVPVLLDMMQDEELRSAATLVFIKMGPAAAKGDDGKKVIEALTIALDDGNADTQTNAIVALGKIGPEAEEAVPRLAKLLKDVPELRMPILDALAGIGEKAQEAVDALLPLFEEKDKKLRKKVTGVLVKIGKPALSPLCAALSDSKVDVRLGAVETLGEMGAKARYAKVIQFLQVAMLRDPSRTVKLAAQKAIIQIRSSGKKKSGGGGRY
jgi:HEAT repeat protein/S1-C subfamily serine protease